MGAIVAAAVSRYALGPEETRRFLGPQRMTIHQLLAAAIAPIITITMTNKIATAMITM